MKRLLPAALVAAVMFLCSIPTVDAQDVPPQFRPLELWACNFRDRTDQEDMDRVYRMTETADADIPYAAWQLNPMMVGSRINDFEFIYIGAWADMATWGADLQRGMPTPPDYEEAWNETADCQGFMYASMGIQDVEDAAAENFILTISDCSRPGGASLYQAIDAIDRFNDYRVENGVTILTRAWFPMYGDGTADFDFKLIHAYTGPQALGDANQWYADNQAYRAQGDLMEGVVNCDE